MKSSTQCVYLQEIALTISAFLMGLTFLLIKQALPYVGGMFLVGTRFTLGALLLLPLGGINFHSTNIKEFKASSLIGISLALACILQTIGLHYIPINQSSFITALYIPLVPLFQWFVTKKAPSLILWCAILISFSGVAILTAGNNVHFHFGIGEILTLGCSVSAALAITLMSYFSPLLKNKRRSVVIQLCSAGIFSFIGMSFSAETIPELSMNWAVPIILLALVSTLIQLLSTWAQKEVSASKATLIYAGEPIWASLIGWYALGEMITRKVVIGGTLILSSILLINYKSISKKNNPMQKWHME